MNELRGCQKYSMGPNFIYFGAQKYGYRPIPSEIETEELMKLIGVLETMGNDVTLLKKWYRKDNNKVPPESILLPITTHLPHFLNKRMPKLQASVPPNVPKDEDGLIVGSGLWYLVGNSWEAPTHAEKSFTGKRSLINHDCAEKIYCKYINCDLSPQSGSLCQPAVHD